MTSTFDFIDTSETKEAGLDRLIEAMADVKESTGRFFANAANEADLASRLDYVADSLSEIAEARGVAVEAITANIQNQWDKANNLRTRAQDVVAAFKEAAHVFQNDTDREQDTWRFETDEGEVRSGFADRAAAEEALRDHQENQRTAYQEGVDCPGSGEGLYEDGMGQPMPGRRVVECPECGQEVPVNVDGYMYTHLAPGKSLSDRA